MKTRFPITQTTMLFSNFCRSEKFLFVTMLPRILSSSSVAYYRSSMSLLTYHSRLHSRSSQYYTFRSRCVYIYDALFATTMKEIKFKFLKLYSTFTTSDLLGERADWARGWIGSDLWKIDSSKNVRLNLDVYSL